MRQLIFAYSENLRFKDIEKLESIYPKQSKEIVEILLHKLLTQEEWFKSSFED